MGYDIKVTETEFQRWFSIWNWHRCLVIAFAGLGLIDDDETERQLMVVNGLQYRDQSMDPNDEDEVRFRIQTAKTPDEATIVQTSYDYDRDGRIIGGNATMPVSMEMKIDDSFNEGILSMLRMQTETNHLLIAHRKDLGFRIKDCKRLHNMAGEEISPDITTVLGIGAMLGLEQCSIQSIDIWKALGLMLKPGWDDDQEEPDLHLGQIELRKRIENANNHTPTFVLDELWDEVGTIGSFCGVMFEALGSNSTITIT